MALSAVAVLLSVAFVCGHPRLHRHHEHDLRQALRGHRLRRHGQSPKAAEERRRRRRPAGPSRCRPPRWRRCSRPQGVKSAEGARQLDERDRRRPREQEHGLRPPAPRPSPATGRATTCSPMEITSGHAPRGPTEVMVDADTADKHHLKHRRRAAHHRRRPATSRRGSSASPPSRSPTPVRPSSTSTPPPRSANCSAGTGRVHPAQRHRGRRGQRRRSSSRTSPQALGSRRTRCRPPKETADANREDVGAFLDVMKYAMLGFAGIALLVGIFLIVNTFSMLVAQRTREIGLMRAIGSSRKQVNRSVLVEALLLGVVGSVARRRRRASASPIGLMKLMGTAGMNLSTDDLTVEGDHPGRRPASSASSSPSSPPTSRPAGPARSPRWPPCATPAPRPTAGPDRIRAVDRPRADRRRRLRPATPAAQRRQGERRLAAARPGRRAHPDRLRRHRPAARGRCGPGARRRAPAGLRPGRPDGRAQRAAQPAPHGRHRRGADDRPRPGRLPVGGRLLDGRLRRRAARQVGRRGLHRPAGNGQPDHAAGREAAKKRRRASTHVTDYKDVDADAHHARRQDAQGPSSTAADPTYAADLRRDDHRGHARATPTARTRCRVGRGLRQGARRQGRRHDRPSPSRAARRRSSRSRAITRTTTSHRQGRACTPSIATLAQVRARPTRCRRQPDRSPRPKDGRGRTQAYTALKDAARRLPAVPGPRPDRLQEELKDQVGQLPEHGLRPARPGDHRRGPGRGQHPGPVGGRADPGDRPDAGDRPLAPPAAPDDPPGVGGDRPLRRPARPRPGHGLGRDGPEAAGPGGPEGPGDPVADDHRASSSARPSWACSRRWSRPSGRAG